MKGLAAGAAGLLLAVPLLVVVLLSGSDCAPDTAAGGSVGQVDVGALPVDQVGSYSGEQLVNAAYIMNAGEALGLSARGQAIGVMTAMGESSLRVLDNGDAVGPDSRGLFQQRGNGAWGSYEDRMDPTISSTNFFKALQKVPGWESLDPTIAAHRVQGNADPYHYERFWDSAVEVISALAGVQLDPSSGAHSGGCTVGATGDYNTAYAKPGPWGGYSNGRIDESRIVPIPWTTNQSYQGTQFLRPDAAAGLSALNNAFRAEFGHDLPINDAYRDFEAQVKAKEEYGAEAATPGTSNHGWALAIDVGTTSHARISYGDSTYVWLKTHASDFGYIHPAWAEPGGSGPHEAWHWEFWGIKQ